MSSKVTRREFFEKTAAASLLRAATVRPEGLHSIWQHHEVSSQDGPKSIVLENTSSRFELGTDGYPRSFVGKARGKEYLARKPIIPTTLMQLNTTTASSVITGCSFSSGRFIAEFGAAGVTAVFEVTAYDDYFHWKLVDLKNGENVTSIRVFHVLVEIRDNRGEILNIAWNDQFAVCALAISSGVRAQLLTNADTGLTLTLYRETGLVGSEWAIMACPRRRAEEVIGQIADAHGLPNPKINGVRAKYAPFNRKSYFFTLMNEANHESVLEICKAAGIRLVLPNFLLQFAGNVGHYNLWSFTYPGGEFVYKTIVRKFHKAGIGVGMHVYFPVIDHFDGYANPKFDQDLVRANAFVLAEDMDENSSAIHTERPPIGMLQGGSLLIEDERVDFNWVSWRKPFGFYGLERGAYKTRPVAHKAGTIVYLLGIYAGKVQMNTHSDLVTKVSQNISRFVNKFGLDMIYYDANEGPLKIAQSRVPTHWYDRTTWHKTIWSMLDRQDIVIESSDIQHYDWHLNTRGTCGDPDVTRPQAEDPYYKRRQPQLLGYADQIANLLPPTLGWSLLHGEGPGLRGLPPSVPPTTVRDIEIHLDVARRLDCPVSFEITENDWKTNKDIGAIFKLLNDFETKRLKRYGI